MAKTSFKQLEAFAAVSDTQSFSAAAKKLGLAQSSISKHIQEFESNFFHPLLDRGGRTTKLTLEGLETLDCVREILDMRDVILQLLSGQEGTAISRLRVGLTELTALTWLPLFVERVKSAFPAVNLVISMEQGLALLQRLNIGELDLIVLPDVYRSANILSTPLAMIRNAWFCSQSFPISHDMIPAQQLSNYTLLLQSQQSTAGVFLGKWMTQHAVFPKETFFCDSLVALGGIAASGLGAAVLPSAVSSPLVKEGLLREIKIRPALELVPYSIITRTEVLPSLMKEIIGIAQSVCDYETPYSLAHPARRG